MLDIMSPMQWLLTAFGLITLLAGAFLIIRSSSVKTNLQAQGELIDTLLKGKEVSNGAIKDLENRAAESEKKVAGLTGQVDVLKNIPLKEIAAAQIATAAELKTLATTQQSIAATQHGILELLSNNTTQNGGGNAKGN